MVRKQVFFAAAHNYDRFIFVLFSFRVIVMVTDHHHFLSAYFMNMITMPLQLTSGALSFQAASYHFGSFGIE